MKTIEPDQITLRARLGLMFRPRTHRDVVQLGTGNLKKHLELLDKNHLRSVCLSCGCKIGKNKKEMIDNILLSKQIQDILLVTKKK